MQAAVARTGGRVGCRIQGADVVWAGAQPGEADALGRNAGLGLAKLELLGSPCTQWACLGAVGRPPGAHAVGLALRCTPWRPVEEPLPGRRRCHCTRVRPSAPREGRAHQPAGTCLERWTSLPPASASLPDCHVRCGWTRTWRQSRPRDPPAVPAPRTKPPPPPAPAEGGLPLPRTLAAGGCCCPPRPPPLPLPCRPPDRASPRPQRTGGAQPPMGPAPERREPGHLS